MQSGRAAFCGGTKKTSLYRFVSWGTANPEGPDESGKQKFAKRVPERRVRQGEPAVPVAAATAGVFPSYAACPGWPWVPARRRALRRRMGQREIKARQKGESRPAASINRAMSLPISKCLCSISPQVSDNREGV
jgi:hypothetical protein